MPSSLLRVWRVKLSPAVAAAAAVKMRRSRGRDQAAMEEPARALSPPTAPQSEDHPAMSEMVVGDKYSI